MNLLKLIDIGGKIVNVGNDVLGSVTGKKDHDNSDKTGWLSFLNSIGKFQITFMIIGVIIFAIMNPDVIKEIVFKLLDIL